MQQNKYPFLYILFLVLFFFSGKQAKAQYFQSEVMFNGKNETAFAYILYYPDSIVQIACETFLQGHYSVRGKVVSGFQSYLNYVSPNDPSQPANKYVANFRFEKRSEDKTILYMIVFTMEKNGIETSVKDHSMFKVFQKDLESISIKCVDLMLQNSISEQEVVVSELENELEILLKERSILEQNPTVAQEIKERNKRAIQKKKANLETAKKTLQELKL